MKLYRDFFEGKGWSPERLNALTPGQLLGIAGDGGGGKQGRRFGSIAEAAAAFEAEKRARAAATAPAPGRAGDGA